MKTGRYVFPPFAVDTQTGSCCRDSVEIRLRAKTFAVLCYLLERAGQLVSKDELLAQVWTGTAVAEGALTVCITELRKALGDDPKSPRFIATVPKRGYRFIAPITTVDAPATSSPPLATSHSAPESTGIPQPGPGNATLEPGLVGRERAATMHPGNG
jgi:DNA-binding winged helix-turn-helix (wHTH) protein